MPSARFTDAQLRRGLAALTEAAGLNPAGAKLIKVTNNAVWRLTTAPIVVRMATTPALLHRTPTVIAAARWLAGHQAPAVRLAELPQPLTATDGTGAAWTATTWHAESEQELEPTGWDLGVLLRTVHSLPAPEDPLPRWDPLADIRRRLSDAEDLADSDREVLHRLVDELARDLATVRYALPPGPIHGDAHLGNLIPTARGVVLCDFDSCAMGPREVDLVPTAVGQLRFRRSPRTQQELVDAYGTDVTSWSGWPVLRRLRELKLVTSALPILASQPEIADRWRERMRSLRDGDERRWTPYS